MDEVFKIQDYDPQLGIATTVHRVEGKAVIQKTYDAEPFIEAAKSMRHTSSGERWGELRHVGFIPPAELGKMMRQDGGLDRKRLTAWLKANPALVTFDRLLK